MRTIETRGRGSRLADTWADGVVGLWCSGSVNVQSTENGECLDCDILPAIAGSHCNSPALAGASLHSTCGKISTSIYGTTPSTTAGAYLSNLGKQKQLVKDIIQQVIKAVPYLIIMVA